MSLNTKKTCVIHMNPDPVPPTFYFRSKDSSPPTAVPTTNTVKYLGITINSKGTLHSHLKPRFAFTRKTFGTLQQLWSHSNISKQFKLKVYKAIFPPMALYGAHYDWHIQTTQNYIDAWHVKLLRRTMGWKVTYIDRTKPNSWVYQHTRSAPLSKQIAGLQNKFYAHIARSPNTLQHSVTFGPGQPGPLRQLNSKKRVGRPRQHWGPNVENQLLLSLLGHGVSVQNRQQLHVACQDRNLVRQVVSNTQHTEEARQAGDRAAVVASGRTKKMQEILPRTSWKRLELSLIHI